MSRRSTSALLLVLASALVLAGCSAAAQSGSDGGGVAPAAAAIAPHQDSADSLGDVRAVGTVTTRRKLTAAHKTSTSKATVASHTARGHVVAPDDDDPGNDLPDTDPMPPPPGVVYTDGSMTFDGLHRTWLVATPDSTAVDKRLPLLIDLHGRGAGPRYAAGQSRLLDLVAADHAVALYPAGFDHSWNAGGCCGIASSLHVDDTGFLRALVRQIAARPDVDAARTIVLGFSNGGRLALDLACNDSLDGTGATLRGVVAIESVVSSPCPNGPGVPTLVTAGTDDPLVGYNQATHDPEGGDLPSIQQELANWSHDESCKASVFTGNDLPLETSECKAGPMEFVTVPGGHHSWPASIQPDVNAFIHASLAGDPSTPVIDS